MNVQERMRMCQLIEKMEEHKEYSKKLGLENESSYHRSSVKKRIEKEGNK